MLRRIQEFKTKRLAIIWDDIGGQPRGILCAPAQQIDVKLFNHLISLSFGIVFAAISDARAKAFGLQFMERHTQAEFASKSDLPLYQSVEAREGVTTGISAADRAHTAQVLASEHPQPRLVITPGHMFPVATCAGGVLVKTGFPEAALDLVTIAGFNDVALYLDLVTSTGELAEVAVAENLAKGAQFPLVRMSELIRHRLQTEPLIERITEAKLPTQRAGELRSFIYRSLLHEGEHVALVKGEINSDSPVLVRVQPEHTFSDVFGGSTHNSKALLNAALEAIGENGSGVLVYLRKPSLGALSEQIDALEPAHSPHSMKEYGIGAQILRDLGVRKIDLLTTSKRSLVGLTPFGLEIVSQRALVPDLSTQSM